MAEALTLLVLDIEASRDVRTWAPYGVTLSLSRSVPVYPILASFSSEVRNLLSQTEHTSINPGEFYFSLSSAIFHQNKR